MSCACGHDHHRPVRGTIGVAAGAVPVDLAQPMVALEGRLACGDVGQMLLALDLLPDHIRLSRDEPGCLHFDLWQDEDPLVWHLSALFISDAAYAAHQTRVAASVWGKFSADIARDVTHHHVAPHLRVETSADYDRLDALLTAAFGGTGEARLVQALRADGDLSLSLVAEAAGVVLGHVALSPLVATAPAFSLAPVAVSPKAQGLGIGHILVAEALTHAGAAAVVVLGDPGYYARFGFRTADLVSAYAGPYLQVRGDLPAGSRIDHARAFVAG